MIAVILVVASYAFALALVAFLGWLGVWLFVISSNGSKLSFGLGLVAFAGAFVVLWSIAPRIDSFRPPGVEVKAADQPELFAQIRQVAEATHQPVPAHVYLVSEVTAENEDICGFATAVLRHRRT